MPWRLWHTNRDREGKCKDQPNDYLGEQICIRQWESWSDNNGTPGAPSLANWNAASTSPAALAWYAELHSDWAW
jgi:hypothetical protein